MTKRNETKRNETLSSSPSQDNNIVFFSRTRRGGWLAQYRPCRLAVGLYALGLMDETQTQVRLLPIRPRSRCERRSLRTFPVPSRDLVLHPPHATGEPLAPPRVVRDSNRRAARPRDDRGDLPPRRSPLPRSRASTPMIACCRQLASVPVKSAHSTAGSNSGGDSGRTVSAYAFEYDPLQYFRRSAQTAFEVPWPTNPIAPETAAMRTPARGARGRATSTRTG